MRAFRLAAVILILMSSGKNKARLILLNKSDLAEERINDEWIDYFKDRGYSAVKVNSKKRRRYESDPFCDSGGV